MGSLSYAEIPKQYFSRVVAADASTSHEGETLGLVWNERDESVAWVAALSVWQVSE